MLVDNLTFEIPLNNIYDMVSENQKITVIILKKPICF